MERRKGGRIFPKSFLGHPAYEKSLRLDVISVFKNSHLRVRKHVRNSAKSSALTWCCTDQRGDAKKKKQKLSLYNPPFWERDQGLSKDLKTHVGFEAHNMLRWGAYFRTSDKERGRVRSRFSMEAPFRCTCRFPLVQKVKGCCRFSYLSFRQMWGEGYAPKNSLA